VSPSYVEEVVTNAKKDDRLERQDGRKVRRKFVVRESVQQSAGLNLFELFDHVSVASTRRCDDNVLVEGPGYEDDENEEIDHCAYCSHCFWAIPISFS